MSPPRWAVYTVADAVGRLADILATRRGCYEIPSGDLALLFARKPTEKMKENAK